MEYEDEKKELLPEEDKSDSGSYGTPGDEPTGENGGGSVSESSRSYTRSKATNFFYKHREIIPGYGMWQLLRKGGVYPLYVLFALLVAYLLNQLDRYTLPVVATAVGGDLHYGDKGCEVNPHVSSHIFDESNATHLKDLCTVDNKTLSIV